MRHLIIMAALGVGGSPAAGAADHHGTHHHENLETRKSSADSLYHLDAKWTDQDGKAFRLKDLRGKPVVIAMIYTSCKTACPLIVEDMRKIQKALSPPAKDAARFVAVSLDPQRDSAGKLREYKEARALDDRWTLLRGDAGAVRKLAAALGVQYRRESNGDFQHSFLVSVLDGAGEIAFRQSGLGHDPKAAAAAVEAAAKR